MNTLFGDLDESQLDKEVLVNHDAPAPTPGNPAVDHFVETYWYLKGTKTLARKDMNVVCKPTQLGASAGRA